MKVQEIMELFEKSKYSLDELYEYDEESQTGQYCVEQSNHPFDVIINISEDNLDIYMQICFEDCDSLMLSYYSLREKYKIQNYLIAKNIDYDIDYDDGYGTPFVDVNIGFFDITDNEKVHFYVDLLSSYKYDEFCCDFKNDILKDEMLSIMEIKTDIINKIKENIGNVDEVLISGFTYKEDQLEIGFLEDQCYDLDDAISCSIYVSDKCFFAKDSNKTYIADVQIINKWLKGVSFVTQDEYEINCYIINGTRIVLTASELYIIVPIIFKDENLELIKEKNRLTELLKQLCGVMPQELYNTSYNLMSLTADEFECLCFEYLHRNNYSNIVRRGKINAPDGEVDIEADSMGQDAIKMSHWIFQCKRTKKQIHSQEIYDIKYLVQHFSAFGYGLFYANYFTPTTVNKIRNIEINDHISTMMIDKNNLETFLYYNPDIAFKFFGNK